MAQTKGILNPTAVQTNTKRVLKDAFFIVIGIFAAAFGLESFLLPNTFIDGGVTGISLLISEVTKTPLWIFIVLINLPFIFMAYKVVGKQFAIKTAIAILGLAFTLLIIEFPEVTQDKLLVAVFGGFFLGAGIGLSIRGGSVLDGTEVLAIFLSKKWGVKIGDIIILINGLIFLAAAYLLSIESALYSMLTYLAASKTLDFVVEGIEEYTGVTIISKKSEEIRRMIVEKMGRGLTIYEAKGGYGNLGEQNEYDVIYTVITRLEIRKLHIEIDKIDSSAFVVMSSINDTKGGMVKKRYLNS
ncbi:YitT family protein [Flagellimonas myxillae]|uniref:YitT family protein n=1 Tax=Flagellimonas myxillae TaxID=2942214 RepID=UPI00201EBBB7|nr:YitT family protein [Muricauda myxillae]MCL6267537.1 YitT family protein [Muricauda myxillae]